MIPELDYSKYSRVIPDKNGKIGTEVWTYKDEDGKTVTVNVQFGQIEIDWKRMDRDIALLVYREIALSEQQKKPSRTLWQSIVSFFGF